MTDDPPPSAVRQMELDLPAVHRAVRVARDLVRRFARMEGLVDREVETLQLVVSEFLANAVDHGGGGHALSEEDLESGVRMRLGFQINGSGWRLAVSDQGAGDPDQIRKLFDTDSPPDLEDERGRGLFLVGTMVDAVEVEKSADQKGVMVTAIRRYAAS